MGNGGIGVFDCACTVQYIHTHLNGTGQRAPWS